MYKPSTIGRQEYSRLGKQGPDLEAFPKAWHGCKGESPGKSQVMQGLWATPGHLNLVVRMARSPWMMMMMFGFQT